MKNPFKKKKKNAVPYRREIPEHEEPGKSMRLLALLLRTGKASGLNMIVMLIIGVIAYKIDPELLSFVVSLGQIIGAQ